MCSHVDSPLSVTWAVVYLKVFRIAGKQDSDRSDIRYVQDCYELEGVVMQSASQVPLPFNLLKATGYVGHQQFSIQQLYVLPTLYLCVLYLSENKQRLVQLTA